MLPNKRILNFIKLLKKSEITGGIHFFVIFEIKVRVDMRIRYHGLHTSVLIAMFEYQFAAKDALNR